MFRVSSKLTLIHWECSIAPPINLNKKEKCWLVCMLVGAHKGFERVPTQFLSRLRVSDPTMSP